MVNKLIPVKVAPAVQALIDSIQLEMEQGKERAYLAMEQEKKRTYWNVGKHIKEHLLENEDRADYGVYLFTVLAENLDIHRRTLYQCVQFYEECPKIVSPGSQLTWTHIRTLLTINKINTRKNYEKKIERNKLSVRELRTLIKKDKGLSGIATSETVPKLSVTRDEPFVYRLENIRNKKMIDLGFRVFIESPCLGIRTEADSIQQVAKLGEKYKFTAAGKSTVPYYTYQAHVVDVLDGDTIWMDIDLGFKTWIRQKLRLKGINTQELETVQGQVAKDFIESKLKGCEFLAVKTYWADKFTRYLADVFYDKKETDFSSLIQNGRHLNQELLDKGLALKY
jgi:endonuclease YncB( thermonuclease family)